MEKLVNFRDRQELNSGDLNNIQAFAAQSLRSMVLDSVGNGQYYSGLFASIYSPTEIRIEAGRYYSDGKVCIRELQAANSSFLSEIYSVFEYLPTTNKRVVAVLAFGQEIDTDIQPKDFLINLETGATEPQAVPMQKLRLAAISLLAGTESPVPQLPLIPSGTLRVATVTLNTTGIERIDMNTDARVPNAADLLARAIAMELWRQLVESRIISISSDVAALTEKASDNAADDIVFELIQDVARLKEKVDVSDGYASYAADFFLDTQESDEDFSSYDADVGDGLTFPSTAAATVNLALFNPVDPGVTRTATDDILPAYTVIKRFGTTGYSGDMSLTIQTQTNVVKKYKVKTVKYKYGWKQQNSKTWWVKHCGKKIKTRVTTYKWKRYRVVSYKTKREVETVTVNVPGSVLAQTFLASNALWLARIGLFFTSVGPSGDVNVIVCETDAGKPNLQKTLTQFTIPKADMKTYPTETATTFAPVFLEAGKRYAIVLITQGNHRAAVVSGANYTDGTLFQGTNDDFLPGTDAKDLMFNVYACQFAKAYTEVVLQGVSLSGGVTDLDIEAPHYIPEGTQVSYQIQVSGIWRPLEQDTYYLQSAPDIVPLRVILEGTKDVAPALTLTSNAIVASRAKTAFTHFSSLRTLGATTTQVQVQIETHNFDPLIHTLTCQIIRGDDDTPISAASSSNVVQEDDTRRFTFNFTSISPALPSYRVKIAGTRSNANSAPYSVTERIDIAF